MSRSAIRIPYQKYSLDNTVMDTRHWHVRIYGDGVAITVHNRNTNTSLGIEGSDAHAVLVYAEALEEKHPRTPRDAIWAAVWRDFEMDEHAKPERSTVIEYTN